MDEYKISTFEGWLYCIRESGNLCNEYCDKVDNSLSNKQLVDICLDANGVSFLPQMEAKGTPLPYEVITRRFGSFINGRYTAQHETSKGKYYTSSIYCCFQGNINAETTLLTLLGCDCSVLVKDNHIIQIYCDKNTELDICCPTTSKAIVHYWGKEPEYSGNVELVKEG